MLSIFRKNGSWLACCLCLAFAVAGCGTDTQSGTPKGKTPDGIKGDGTGVPCAQVTDMEACETREDCAVEPGHCLFFYCHVDDPDCCEPAKCVAAQPECPPVMCELYCEHGFEKGENGCEICVCAEAPPACDGLEQAACEAREDCVYTPGPCLMHCHVDDPGCCQPGTCSDKDPGCSPVMCELYCEHGFDKDENGCEICACADPAPQQCSESGPIDALCGTVCMNGYKIVDGEVMCTCCEPECPQVMCALYCEHGFKKDENGCDVCDCVEREPASGSCVKNSNDQCDSDADCVAGGCGGELCYNPAFGGGMSTCECTAPQGVSCGCVNGSCTWWN